MLRHSTLSHARPITLLWVLVTVALPTHSARSQDRAVPDRLERLEKDLSMLQRQVYRGGASPVVAMGHNAAVDTELRMDRLEAEMRDLTGRVENAVNGVEQLRRRLEQLNSDIDVRFGQGQGQSATAAPRSAAGAAVAGTLPPRGTAPTLNQTASTQPTPASRYAGAAALYAYGPRDVDASRRPPKAGAIGPRPNGYRGRRRSPATLSRYSPWWVGIGRV